MNRNVLYYPIGEKEPTNTTEQLIELITAKATEMMCKDSLLESIPKYKDDNFADADEYCLGIIMNALRLEESRQ